MKSYVTAFLAGALSLLATVSFAVWFQRFAG